ncbi:MAG: alpha-hydroxy-acid oxidizing protein, partial [Salinicola sp.]
ADSGVRSGLDVVRMLALGAKGVLLGRAYAYALAADGERGVAHLLELIAADMRVTMTLIGARSPADISADHLETVAKALESEQRPAVASPEAARF